MMKTKHMLGLLGFSVLAATFAPAAMAADAPGYTVLAEGQSVRPPRAYSEMCERRPELCPSRAVGGELDQMKKNMARAYGRAALTVAPPTLTRERFATLQQVNLTVNRTIRPVADSGRDFWSFSSIAGDCEEYVMMKRELLAGLGWPRSALRITVVKDLQNAYHAVLVVSTSQGEFVLDNMTNEITRVETSPYSFVVAQSAQRPGVWVRVKRTL